MAVRVLLVVLCAILGHVPGTAHGAQPHREIAPIHGLAWVYAYDHGRIAQTARLVRVGTCTHASDAAPIDLTTGHTSGCELASREHAEHAHSQRERSLPIRDPMSIRVSPHFGIVVRKRALDRLSIDETKLLSLMETEAAYDADPELISFGPHFGEEAAEELVRRLKDLGLQYAEDFFQVSSDVPEWCGMSCYVLQEA